MRNVAYPAEDRCMLRACLTVLIILAVGINAHIQLQDTKNTFYGKGLIPTVCSVKF